MLFELGFYFLGVFFSAVGYLFSVFFDTITCTLCIACHASLVFSHTAVEAAVTVAVAFAVETAVAVAVALLRHIHNVLKQGGVLLGGEHLFYLSEIFLAEVDAVGDAFTIVGLTFVVTVVTVCAVASSVFAGVAVASGFGAFVIGTGRTGAIGALAFLAFVFAL